jgi:hypothetical protein
LRSTLLENQAIDAKDLNIFQVTDSPEEAVAIVKEIAFNQFGLTYRYRPKRWKIFWER